MRTDVLLVATPDTVAQATSELNPAVSLRLVENSADFARFVSEFDAGYYPGYTASWQAIWGWGETLALALVNDRVAGFGWLQTGVPGGFGCPYACLFPGEFRVVRVGVLPSYRGRGVNTTFYHLLLRHLFSQRVSRVYIDCAKDNLPSLKAQLRAGFQPIGEMTVLGPMLGGHFIRLKWKRVAPDGGGKASAT